MNTDVVESPDKVSRQTRRTQELRPETSKYHLQVEARADNRFHLWLGGAGEESVVRLQGIAFC